jgi:hypothetical protein
MPKDIDSIPKHVAIMRIIVSLVLLIGGSLILTAPNIIIPTQMNDGVQKAAFGWIGAIIGYWLA